MKNFGLGEPVGQSLPKQVCLATTHEFHGFLVREDSLDQMLIAVVSFPSFEGAADVVQVVDAVDSPSLLMGRSERGQNHRRKQSSHTNDYKKFSPVECFYSAGGNLSFHTPN